MESSAVLMHRLRFLTLGQEVERRRRMFGMLESRLVPLEVHDLASATSPAAGVMPGTGDASKP